MARKILSGTTRGILKSYYYDWTQEQLDDMERIRLEGKLVDWKNFKGGKITAKN